jgi:hypothetical protein
MSAATLTLDQEHWRPRYNPWLIAVVVALAAFMEVLQAQAATLAYVDTFMVLAVGSGIMFPLAFLLKKNDPGAARDLATE